MFRSLYKVLRPCDSVDLANRKEDLSLKKLRAGDCMWLTCQVLLLGVIYMVNMMLSLPTHRKNSFKEILDEIPTSQKRIGVDKWRWVLGEIHSVDTALPGAQGLFNHMQDSLCHMEGKMVVLTRSVDQALVDFRWMAEDLSKRPMSLYELVPLRPTMDGYHNASGYMCVDTVLLIPMAVP